MAKRKPTNAKPKPAASTKRATPSSTSAKPAPAKKAAARNMSHIEIGHVAGELWGHLANGGEKSIADLKKAVNASDELVLAAIGWLAREDKLEFKNSGKALKIALR